MFHQQDEMVSSYLFSFRETGCPLFGISEFCLLSYLAPLKCQQNLGFKEETEISRESGSPSRALFGRLILVNRSSDRSPLG